MKKLFFVLCCSVVLLFGCQKKAGQENVSIKGDSGNQIYPQKIISLSPASTEILFAIGAEDQIAAVSDFSDYPPEAKTKAVIGGFDGKTISIEVLLSYKPDFAYLTSGMHDFLIPTLEKYNIKYYLSSGESVEGVIKEILEIGEITGHKTEAEKLTKNIQSQIAKTKTDKSEKTTVYYEVWNAPYMTCGTSSFLHDVLQKAGLKNIFDDISEPYPIISEETLIARNPQVILISQSSGLSAEDVKKRKGWQNISAVKNDKIFIVDDNLTTRPGPRIGQAIVTINSLIQK